METQTVKVQLVKGGSLANSDIFFDGKRHSGFVHNNKTYNVIEVVIDEYPAYYMVYNDVSDLPDLFINGEPKKAIATDEGMAYACDLDHAFDCLRQAAQE